ncbi:hypothetical protein OROHE_023988 [Orobanche hederae]
MYRLPPRTAVFIYTLMHQQPFPSSPTFYSSCKTMSDHKATIIDGKAIAQTIRSEIAAEVRRLSETYGQIRDSCKLLLHAWYLDDGTVIGDVEEVARVLDVIGVAGPSLGLQLNIKKTELFWPSCDGRKLRNGLFPVSIGRPLLGVKLLGGAASIDAGFIRGLAMKRAVNAVDLMSLLPQLCDPQSELLLLRSCMGIAKLFFGLRTCQPIHMQEAALFFDRGLRGSIEDIVVCGGPFFGEIQCGLGQRMSPVEYRTILKYRLMIPIFPVDETCIVCRKACLDAFGERAVHCRELPGFKYRHDMVRDVLFDVFRRAGVSAKKEAPVNFLTDPLEGRSTLRPADVLVFGWEGGKHACVDLTGVSPLVGLGSGGFTAGQAALKAASCKVVKHEKACMENQHAFIPFAFDTFGFLAPEAVDLLKRVQKVMHSNVPGLAVVIVGQRKDSQSYVSMKRKACAEVGIKSIDLDLPEEVSESELICKVHQLNSNPDVHGILVQLPLPKHINEESILSEISLAKDVDGFHPLNIGKLAMKGRDPLFVPCTPKGCIELISRSGICIKGKNAVVVGRSNIVGLPVSLLLLKEDATVTVVHSRTKEP